MFVDMSNLLNRGHIDVSCLFLLESGLLGSRLDENINRIELRRTNKFSFIKMLQCARILDKYDIIHCHMRHVYRYVRLISILFYTRGKVVLHEHSGFIDRNKKSPFLFKTLLKPEYFIGVFTEQLNWARHRLNIPTERIFLLRNIVLAQEDTTYKRITRISDIVVVGNIKSGKNQVFSVNISNRLSMSLNIIGNNQDNSYFQQIQRLIKKHSADVKIYENIECARNEVSGCKIGMSASLHESGPLVLIEFLAAGLPFIAYRTGEVANIVAMRFPEFFMDNFNEDDWVLRVEQIIGKNYDKDELINFCKEQFSPDKYFNETINIYEKICAS